MKDIRIFMLHSKTVSVDTMLKYLNLENLKDEFNFIWDEVNPEYLISTEHIFFYKKYQKKFKELHDKVLVNIEFLAELYPPDLSLFDYSVSFFSRIKCDDRHQYILSPDKFYKSFVSTIVNDINSYEEAAVLLGNKKKFCNFLYSNSNAHPNRDYFFHLLSKYKVVDSLGKWMNNVGNKPQGFIGHQGECNNLKAPYKFSIAFENATCAGYSSEKILTSLNAHTVPIYWGDPDIENYINPACFINCNKFNNFGEVIEEVKKIDADDKLWCEMISQPWQTPEQVSVMNKRNDDYLNFWKKIFSENRDFVKRAPSGYHPSLYLQYFSSGKILFRDNFLRKIYNKTKKLIKNK